MKYLGMVIFIASTTGAGIFFSAKIKEKLLIFRDLTVFCDILSIDIRCRKNSLFSLIEKNNLSHLSFIKADMLRKKKKIISPLTADDNERISLFVYSLGKSDEGSQLTLINGFREYAKNREREYEEKYKRDMKLFPSLGFFAGAALCLALVP